MRILHPGLLIELLVQVTLAEPVVQVHHLSRSGMLLELRQKVHKDADLIVRLLGLHFTKCLGVRDQVDSLVCTLGIFDRSQEDANLTHEPEDIGQLGPSENLGKHRPRFPADQAGANFDPVTFDPVTSDHVTSDHGTSNGTSNLEQAHPRRRRGPICTISRAGRLADRCTHSCSPWCPFPAFVGDEHSPQCPTYTMTSWSVAAKSEHLAPGEEALYLRHLPGGIGARTSHDEAIVGCY